MGEIPKLSELEQGVVSILDLENNDQTILTQIEFKGKKAICICYQNDGKVYPIAVILNEDLQNDIKLI